MGVDLAFQRVQLRLGLLDFRQIHLFCVGVQLGAHLVEALGQIAQLIVAGHRDAAGKITGLDLAHVLHNGADGLGQLAGEKHRTDDKRSHSQRNHQPHSPLHGADLRFDGGAALAAPDGQPVFGDRLGQKHRAGRGLRRHIQCFPHKCRIGGKITVTGLVRDIDSAAVGQVQRSKQPVKHIGAQVQKERTQIFFLSDCAGNVVIVAPNGKDIRRARAAKADIVQRMGGHKPHFAAFGVPMLKIHRPQIGLTVKQGVVVVSQLVADHLSRARRGIDKVGGLNVGVRHIQIVQKQPHFVADAVSGVVRIGKNLTGQDFAQVVVVVVVVRKIPLRGIVVVIAEFRQVCIGIQPDADRIGRVGDRILIGVLQTGAVLGQHTALHHGDQQHDGHNAQQQDNGCELGKQTDAVRTARRIHNKTSRCSKIGCGRNAHTLF